MLETTSQPETVQPYQPWHKDISINQLIDLRLKRLTYQEIADLLGCSKTNVAERLAPFKESIDGLESYKKRRADILSVHQQRILSNLTDEKIQKAPLNVLAPAFGILYDKERIERGQPTEIIDVSHFAREVKDIDAEIMEMERRLLPGTIEDAEIVDKSVESVDK